MNYFLYTKKLEQNRLLQTMLELHFLNCTMTLEHKDTLSQEHRHRTYTYGTSKLIE